VQRVERDVLFQVVVGDNPEFTEDEVLRADMFEGETDLYSVLTMPVDAKADAADLVDALTTTGTDAVCNRAPYVAPGCFRRTGVAAGH